MVIRIADLSLQPHLQAGFDALPASQEAYHSWDTNAIICNTIIDAVLILFLVRHGSVKRVSLVHVSIKSLLMVAQVLQLWMIIRRPRMYTKVRVPVAATLRMLRNLSFANRFRQRGGGPSSCRGYAAYMAAISSNWYPYSKAVPSFLLLEPCGAMVSVMREHLPVRLNFALLAFRAVAQLRLSVPALACALMHPSLQSRTRSLCPYAVSLVTMQPAADNMRMVLEDLCSRPSVWVYIETVLLLLIGCVAPFLAGYWYELKTKMNYIRSVHPELAPQLPRGAALAQLLLLQLWSSAVLVVVGAHILSMHTDRLGLDACSATG